MIKLNISTAMSSLWNRFWIRLLANRYINLEFSRRDTIRSLMDTFRNQGIFNFVVKVQGEIRGDAIQIKFLENVIEKRDKQGNLCYPKLKLKLTTCWGNYAWIKDSEFNIDDHLFFVSPSFRGRMISETNIQEYISNIVSKYLPSDVPQWQMFVIPTTSTVNLNVASTSSASESSYYILFRIHHLLLDEENLCIKDLLCLKNVEKTQAISHSMEIEESLSRNYLLDLIEPPIHIPRLYNTITSSIVNRWNEFCYYFDPAIENPSKNSNESLLQLIAVLLIISVTVIQKFYKGFHAVQDNLLIRTRFFQTVLAEECKKRDLSWETVSKVVSPVHAIRDIFHFWAWLGLTFALTFPYKCLLETIAVTQFILNGKPTKRSTFYKVFYDYVPLLWGATKEAFTIFYTIYSGPMLIYQELFGRNKFCDTHSLQKVSLCGRKVISWSDKIDLNVIKAKEKSSPTNETEIVLAAIANSLHDFLGKTDKRNAPPQQFDIGFTGIEDHHLIGSHPLNSDKNGIICLSIPLNSQYQMRRIRNIISKIRETQLPNYVLSKYNRQFHIFTNSIPKVWMRILINYLSRKYPVIVTQVVDSAETREERQKDLMTLWGDPVQDLLYFPPPQSNVCISLILQRFKGSHIRLGVIADAQLSSNQGVISKGFKRHLDTLISEIK
ncbi:uncharacterized protein LOC134829722 isoform X2 [Culicoides brevitarsis]|uniref:uncharacterized protein LOC134829722 isoform X2 n=1 Tax=Culicoides brevitarsis TaxID=469753 RepID=UPI00307B22AD